MTFDIGKRFGTFLGLSKKARQRAIDPSVKSPTKLAWMSDTIKDLLTKWSKRYRKKFTLKKKVSNSSPLKKSQTKPVKNMLDTDSDSDNDDQTKPVKNMLDDTDSDNDSEDDKPLHVHR